MVATLIPNLDLVEYQHRLDEQSLRALESIPGFGSLASLFMQHGLERFYTVQYAGSNLKLTKETCPDLTTQLEHVCSVLGIPEAPHLYVEAEDSVNVNMLGSREPILVLTSGSIERLDVSEVDFLLGHACGYLKGSYAQYQSMAYAVTTLGEVIGDYSLGLGKLLSKPIEFGLLRWSRFSQLSCDRAGLLACQDMDAAMSVFLKMAGLPHGFEVQRFRDAFVEQAKSFERLNLDTASKLIKIASEIGRTHPWTVLRASELIAWIEGGDYEAVLRRESARKAFVKTTDGVEFCRTCSFRLKGNEAFCPSCGRQLQHEDM